MMTKPTRGHGILEPFLARMRARQANRLIPDNLRLGRILDIGCGSYPYFLSHTVFKEKYAVDRLTTAGSFPDIHWHSLDLNQDAAFPFEDAYFDVITLLAVIEHLSPAYLVDIFKEANRLLVPGGMVILTTPAAWSDNLLHWMSRVRLVSKEEIDEHIFAYTLPLIGWYFGVADFKMENVRFGYFELWLNLWATARK